MGLRGRRSQTIAIGAVAGIVAVALGILASAVLLDSSDPRTEPEEAHPGPSTTETTSGLCGGLTADDLADAVGQGATVDVTSTTSCTITRSGAELTLTVDLLNALADEADLDSVRRSSGPSAEDLEPWPTEPIDNVGDGARWLADPDSDGTIGELYLLDGERLIRITATTPPGYRRTPLSMATALAPLLAA